MAAEFNSALETGELSIPSRKSRLLIVAAEFISAGETGELSVPSRKGKLFIVAAEFISAGEWAPCLDQTGLDRGCETRGHDVGGSLLCWLGPRV